MQNETDKNTNLIIKNELFSAEGKTIAINSQKTFISATENKRITLELKVKDAQLWSLNNPYLYRLKTSILKDGKVIDETITNTGFRTFTFNPNKGFALNGEWMKVKGACLHHDAGVLGSAVPREVWKRRLETLKSIGCNAIRTSHNPQSPDLYQLCDELGILVMNEAYDEWEFPKRKWLTGWNQGTPGFQGTFDFFEEWGEIDLTDMIRRDRNHTSIFAWSIGNEVDYPNDPYSHPVLNGNSADGFTQPIFGGYKKDAPDAMRLGAIAKHLVATVRKYDKSRPVTAGLAGVAMSNETEYPGALDIAGYNYTESRYESDHKKYPERIIFGSENRHELSAWQSVKNNDHIFGQFLWTGIDYLGESNKWPSRGFYSGLLDFGGFIKPRGYFRNALWSDTPVAYLGTYLTPGSGGKNPTKDTWSAWSSETESNKVEKTPSMDAWPIWNYEERQLIRVVCYTNADQAKLLLNNKAIGDVKRYDNSTGIIYWDIPYAEGELKVVGMDKDGKEICTFVIRSSKRSYALTIQSGETTISKNRGLSQVVVQVVDENGIPVLLSDDEITCEIDGPVRLLGLEASNNEDMSDYTDNVHRVYHGRILAYIQAKGQEGTAKVRFTSSWLKSAEIIINIK